MIRTQVYLTEAQDAGLKRLASCSNRKQSELIRDAIETYLGQHEPADWKEALRATRGIWADRDDLDELLDESRKSWERRLELLHQE